MSFNRVELNVAHSENNKRREISMAATTTITSSSQIETLPSEPQQAALNPTKRLSIPLQDLTHSGKTLSDPYELRAAENAVSIQETWQYPRINTWRLAAVFYAFINFGMNDACYGALIPYIEQDYNLTYTVAALVFLCPFAGYTVAAFVSDQLHVRYGRRGMAMIGPVLKIAAYIVISCHPPYPVVAAILVLVGVGNGILDAAWNAWISQFPSTNQLLGLLHGCYGLGATISPLIATSIITKYRLGWWEFFYLMTALLVIELGFGTTVFWSETGQKYRNDTRDEEGEQTGMTRKALQKRTTWILSAFLALYVGAEVSIGGWIVTFMTSVRRGAPFASGLSATGFWLGITIGRVTLGFVTPRVGEKLAIAIYAIVALGLQLIFWLVPQFYVSAVAIALVGYFIGPFFPSAVIAAAKLLPPKLHVAAIGFASALGGSGAAILPFIVGAIVQAQGVSTLQPIVLTFLAVLLGIWLTLPKIRKDGRQD